jgi:uncharacterized protein YbjT (DUF2867 family)
MKTALLAGGTGLIGNELLKLLLNDSSYSSVVAISRKPLSVTHAKLTVVIIDFKTLDKFSPALKPDDVFCCVGTTMAKAGSKEKFYEVDFKYPLELAQVTSRLGAKQFLLVSALGADKDSSIYYNKVKGELEEAIRTIDFQAIHIFRPSLLLGPRSERRPGEDVAKIFFKIFGFLVPRKYRAIDAVKVAKSMVEHARQNLQGFFIHESADMQAG